MTGSEIDVSGFSQLGDRVLAATSRGIFQSNDRGVNWRSIGAELHPVHAIAGIDAAGGPRVLLAGGSFGAARSVDQGRQWTRTLEGSPTSALAMSLDHLGVAVELVGTETDGVFRSTDGGANWSSANAGLLDLEILALALSPAFGSDHTAFAGTASGLYRSRNAGKAWRPLELASTDPSVQSIALRVDFNETGVVLAGTEEQGLIRSDDGGQTWATVPFFRDRGVTAVAWSEVSPSTVIAASDEGIARSDDNGETWSQASSASPVLALATIVGEIGEFMLAGLAAGGILRSIDGGLSWRSTHVKV